MVCRATGRGQVSSRGQTQLVPSLLALAPKITGGPCASLCATICRAVFSLHVLGIELGPGCSLA